MRSDNQINFGFIGQVDRRSLILTYIYGSYPSEYVPNFDSYTYTKYKDKKYRVELSYEFDVDFKKLAFLFCRESDVLVLCFSIFSLQSLKYIQNLYLEELGKDFSNKHYILVGLKDEDNSFNYRKTTDNIIPKFKIEEVKNVIGASAYIECSAKNNEHVKDIIIAGIEAILSDKSTPPQCEEHSESKCKTH